MEKNIRVETVIDKSTGKLRQAGTVDPDGELPLKIKRDSERSLWYFTRTILGRGYLNGPLHKPVCNFLQTSPPYRKMLLLPRRHAKTSIVSHGLPLHMLIQPKENNPYFPGRAGRDIRILMAQETERRALDNMRVLISNLEGNQLIKALWPEVTWDNPRAQSRKWNEKALIVPRSIEYPDPTISAIGITGAVTGGRFDAIIKDDLIAEEAANSETVMAKAIDWHTNSRALFDDYDKSLEFIIGTRWAVTDLYSHIMEDPTVEYIVRSIIEDGEPIYPEAFSHETIARLRVEFKTMFPLLFMNSAADPSLTDFAPEDLRFFSWGAQGLIIDTDYRDQALAQRYDPRTKPPLPELKGRHFDRETVESIFHGRDEFFRFRS